MIRLFKKIKVLLGILKEKREGDDILIISSNMKVYGKEIYLNANVGPGNKIPIDTPYKNEAYKYV